jgi:phosphoglycerate dehydrogenase-like enzyme
MKSSLHVLICAPIMGRNLDPIRAVDSSLDVIDGNEAFIALQRARGDDDRKAIERADQELGALLEQADVLCMMYPMLEDAAARAPKLQWLHHTQAGVSNFWNCDVWRAPQITITSGRGHVRTTAIAEYVIAGALAFARTLHNAYGDKRTGRLDRRRYEPIRIEGATLGVIGLGGIGKEVARLARALGMRVLATRRSVTEIQYDVDGADVLLPAAELARLAAESDFIAVCTALTDETQGLLDAEFFAAATRRPVLINISRGEVVDEPALLAALGKGLLRGAVLDVYDGELAGKRPRPELLSHPDVVLTPHISGFGSTLDTRFMDLFCENLRRFVEGRPLINVVDRDRGY